MKATGIIVLNDIFIVIWNETLNVILNEVKDL